MRDTFLNIQYTWFLHEVIIEKHADSMILSEEKLLPDHEHERN